MRPTTRVSTKGCWRAGLQPTASSHLPCAPPPGLESTASPRWRSTSTIAPTDSVKVAGPPPPHEAQLTSPPTAGELQVYETLSASSKAMAAAERCSTRRSPSCRASRHQAKRGSHRRAVQPLTEEQEERLAPRRWRTRSSNLHGALFTYLPHKTLYHLAACSRDARRTLEDLRLCDQNRAFCEELLEALQSSVLRVGRAVGARGRVARSVPRG